MYYLILLILLTSCTALPVQTTKVIDLRRMSLEEVRSNENCREDILPNFGCYRPIKGGCRIMVERPIDTGDRERLATIGLELVKCFDNSKEY